MDWLHALVSDWQLLADLSFADLVLWALLRDGGLGRAGPDAPDDRPDGLSPMTSSARSGSAARGRSWMWPCRNGGSAGRATRNGRPGVPVRHETIPVSATAG